jgi:(1->4)-alpha-D-glucan 1-alpha-D-glucosylmutase
MRNEMASELHALAREAARVAHQNPRTADFTQNVLQRAIREVVACFPVYRTYVDSQGAPSEEDRRDLTWALKKARAKDPDLDPSVYDFAAKLLSGDLVAQPRSGFSRQSALRFAMKVQQYSGPVMAKGLEDTAFYRYNRFVALNEVGGDPDQFGVTLANFHKANVQRAKGWPKSMVTTSTHDTKRGEDTRARLAALSELPEEWAKQVQAWSKILRARRGDIGTSAPPDRNDEYLFYQLLVGTWPAELTGVGIDLEPEALSAYAERVKGAMTKSMREAKVHSTWAAPDTAYESAVLSFVEGALNASESRAFLSAFLPFQERVARLGVQNSLVQTTLKLTAPGVPDIYQGAELWDLSLVDPDNRRPVNYCQRIRLLDALGGAGAIHRLMENWRDGGIKLLVISKLLELRMAEADLFAAGEYEPLVADGPRTDRLVGFLRRLENRYVVVLAARFPAHDDTGWGETSVAIDAADGLRNVFNGEEMRITDGRLDLAAAFDGLPVAVLAERFPKEGGLPPGGAS